MSARARPRGGSLERVLRAGAARAEATAEAPSHLRRYVPPRPNPAEVLKWVVANIDGFESTPCGINSTRGQWTSYTLNNNEQWSWVVESSADIKNGQRVFDWLSGRLGRVAKPNNTDHATVPAVVFDGETEKSESVGACSLIAVRDGFELTAMPWNPKYYVVSG